jgi:hypothetical protein
MATLKYGGTDGKPASKSPFFMHYCIGIGSALAEVAVFLSRRLDLKPDKLPRKTLSDVLCQEASVVIFAIAGLAQLRAALQTMNRP